MWDNDQSVSIFIAGAQKVRRKSETEEAFGGIKAFGEKHKPTHLRS